MRKRVLSILLVLCMVLSLLPGMAWAAESSEVVPLADTMTYGSLSYIVKDGAIEITACDESATNVDIPAQIDGVPVTSIGVHAFYEHRKLNRITIPNGVTYIGGEAFRNCSSLTGVMLPTSITSIEIGTFEGCNNLTSVKIPSGVISIGARAFDGCSGLTSVTIPSSVMSINDYAFQSCSSLINVAIPNGVTSIGFSAFRYCRSLASVVIPSSVASIGQNAFVDCNSITSVTIHDSVTSIGSGAFAGCSGLTSVTISSNVTSLEYQAFGFCSSLTSIAIPSSVTSIEKQAFYCCSSLTNITIPNSATSIGEGAFFDCSGLTDVYYNGSERDWAAIAIDNYNNYNKPLFDATIHYNSTGPGGQGSTGEIKTISGILRSGEGWSIRWECSYSLDTNRAPRNGRVEITASKSNTKEELDLYNDASADGFPWELAPYNIPKNAITSLSICGSISKKLRIAANSFTGYNNLQTVALNGVSGIDSNAFYGCSKLEQLALASPDETLARIGSGAFKNCTSLSKIDFPGALISIGAEAFRNTALGDITLWRNLEEIGENAFADCSNLKISCYENSATHRYAEENNIPFVLIKEDKKCIPFYSPTGKKTTDLDIGWGWNLFRLPTYQYHHQLAALGMILSAATEEYTPDRAIKLCENLGFEQAISANYGSDFDPITWGGQFYPGVLFACHEENGNYIFVITVRGSTDFEDWMTDISAQGFVISAKNIYSQFNTFLTLNGLSADRLKGKTKIFVTGHSLGGAAANALAKTLNDEYGLANVFAYTFAAPMPFTIWGAAGIDNVYNIYNVVNEDDGVPKLPTKWIFQRLGTDRSFHRDSTNGFYENFKLLTGRGFIKGGNNVKSDNAHDVAVYMAYVLSHANGIVIPVQSPEYVIVHIACPVDVEVYTSDDRLVGYIRDNQVISSISDKIYVYIEDDEKHIALVGEDDYSLKMTGTGTGTMTYSVYNDGTSQEIISQKAFDNVALTDGKQFISSVSVWDHEDKIINTDDKTDVPEVKLHILGDDGQPEMEVLPDGNGTEVPIEAPDNPPVSCEHEYTEKITAPTCTERGYTTYTCSKCGNSYADSYTDALGHSYGAWLVATPATSTTSGQQERVCSRCGDKQTNVIPATGGGGNSAPDYSPGSDSTPTYRIDGFTGGSVSITPTSASAGQRVTITAKPNSGYQLEKLTVTDGKNTELTLTDKGSGKYTFTMPSSRVTVDAGFQPIQTPEVPWRNPFTDIAEGEWYYEAVRFVEENGLMNGYGNSAFAPNANLSRAMLAQVLYNKEGRPAVTGSTFADVAEGEWYANAVAWAAEQGIVSGYGNGLFGPNDNITREQLAVMLWLYAGEPAATDKELHFTDEGEASNYALGALHWATENSIVNGYGDGRLGPRGLATRAQVAQMLMNFLKK